MIKPPYPESFYEGPGIIEGRLWWEGHDEYWHIPFYMEMGALEGSAICPDRDDWLAAREQLWAIREQDDEIQPL